MADAIITPTTEFLKYIFPHLKKHLFYFSENVDEFIKKMTEVKAMKDSYDQRLAIATRKKELPAEDVKLWISDYEVILRKCELSNYNVDDLERKKSRRKFSIKRYRLSTKLVKRTKEMAKLIRRYSEFRSLFVEDPVRKNADIVMNFENTKCKLEALRETYDAKLLKARRLLKKPTDEVDLWTCNYEENKRQCEYFENILKNYNTTIGVSIRMGELVEYTNEMTCLIDRYHQFGGITEMFVEDWDLILDNIEKTKKVFNAMIQTNEGHRLSAEKNHKIPTELVRLWMDDCEKLQTKYSGKNTNIQTERESSQPQEEQIVYLNDMDNLIDRYNQFRLLEMFVDQPLEIVEKRSTNYKSLNSMEKTKDKVCKALKDESVIKLFGMGGVGKTTLMLQINNEMLINGVDFKLVIWVTVSTTYTDTKSIQSQIFHRLDFPFLDWEDNHVRAEKISKYLKEHVDGNTLFIFDDVWGALDLKDIGIPSGCYGNAERKCCKIVLTTRDRNVKVINGMPPKDIKMTGLDQNESWIMFKRNASIEDNVDDGIKELAEEICRKCAGLPLVISVVANMLSGEKNEHIWSESLTFLNKDDPTPYIPNLSKEVYVPLKLSYDHLGRRDLKIGFLLCSLFPEDHEIKLSDLICYGIGVGEIAEGCQRFDACRNIFIHLKNKGLLQDAKDDSARMHDVIRDVANFIAKNEFGGFFNKGEFNSNVKFLSLFGNKKIKNEHLDVSLGMENLLLLDLRETSISLQAYTTNLFIKKLKELRVLMFDGYYEKIPVNIKEYFILHKLSVLCLQGVHIEELDKDFGIELFNLRVIDFSMTVIDVIKPKVFLNLQNKLEELHMSGSFNKWRASNQEDAEYATFSELAELKKLYALHVEIGDRRILSYEYQPDLVFSSLEYFSINSVHYFKKWNSKVLLVHDIKLKNVANWLKDLLKKTESLQVSNMEEYLHNDKGGTNVDVVLKYDIIIFMCNLESLELDHLPKSKNAIEYFSNIEGKGDKNLNCTSRPILPKASYLRIINLHELENIFVSTLIPNVIPKGSFQKLRVIDIRACHRLKFIFPWNVATCLVQLHSLQIQSCHQLEVIVEKDNRNYNQEEYVLFPELTQMDLQNLPKLECISPRKDEKLENLKQWLFLDENSAPKLKLIEWNLVVFHL